jgi:hypothetical protein
LPQPAPGAGAPPTAGRGPELAQVRAGWEAFVDLAGRRDARLRDALRRAQPTALAEGRLSLAVTRSDVMARSTLERREMQQAFRLAAREAFGQELAPVVELAAEAPSRGDAQLREHPEVRRIAEATGGRVLQVEREAGPPAPGG